MDNCRSYKRKHFEEFRKTIEGSVLKSWLSVIRKKDIKGVKFTLIEDTENVCTRREGNEVRAKEI